MGSPSAIIPISWTYYSSARRRLASGRGSADWRPAVERFCPKTGARAQEATVRESGCGKADEPSSGGRAGKSEGATRTVGPTSNPIGEHLHVVAIPIALKPLLRIILLFQTEELDELGITRLHLLAGGPTVVSQEVPAAEFDCTVDNSTEAYRRLILAFVGMKDWRLQTIQTEGSLAQARKLSLSFSMKRIVP